jgi:hypothetical protein
MRYVIIFLIIGLTVLSSCKKDSDLPYTFTGKVTDKNGDAVAGATIELNVYYNSNNAISGGGLYKEASTKADNAGNFKVHFNYKGDVRNFEVRVFADNYFAYINDEIFTNNIQNNVLTLNPILYKLSTIKINFKNTTPVSATDEFSVFHSNELIGPPFDTFIERQFTGGTFDNLENKYIGNNIQGYVLTRTKGDTYTVINWTSKKNGVVNYVKDSIIIAGGTQGTYNINY